MSIQLVFHAVKKNRRFAHFVSFHNVINVSNFFMGFKNLIKIWWKRICHQSLSKHTLSCFFERAEMINYNNILYTQCNTGDENILNEIILCNFFVLHAIYLCSWSITCNLLPHNVWFFNELSKLFKILSLGINNLFLLAIIEAYFYGYK